MDIQPTTPETFAATLLADGFDAGETKALPADRRVPEHQHPFDVRALVLAGEITLTVAGEATAYRVGDVFTMAGGCRHAEAVGAEGVEYLVGRRHLAA